MQDTNKKQDIMLATIRERLDNLIGQNKEDHDTILTQVKRINGFVQDHDKDIRNLENWKNRIVGGLVIINIFILPILFWLIFRSLNGSS